MNICIIGTGYVGLVAGTCFADFGNRVICVDNNEDKIKELKSGIVPIYEPGLDELVEKNVREGRLSFSSDIPAGVSASEIIFITVGTPQKKNGEADLSFVEEVSRKIADTMTEYKVIVEKSTVPVETGEKIKRTISLANSKNVDFDVVSNPEFMREGSAVSDFMKPDRIVIGVESQRAKEIMISLYNPIKAPVVITDVRSAEIIKHASNSFLALKISYINAISNLCEKVGADIEKVAEGIGLDKRIGRAFLNAGIGYGGSCFPKDVSAFIKIGEEAGCDLEFLKVTQKINRLQRKLILKKAKEILWVLNNKVIGVWGLSYKPNTDDIRESPSIEIIEDLLAEGARVKAYDPKAMERTKPVLSKLQYCKDPYEVVKEADALIILTDWEEFKNADLQNVKKLLRMPVVIDGRNIFEPKTMAELGFKYASIGRGTV